jgi:hypothetical protein
MAGRQTSAVSATSGVVADVVADVVAVDAQPQNIVETIITVAVTAVAILAKAAAERQVFFMRVMRRIVPIRRRLTPP